MNSTYKEWKGIMDSIYSSALDKETGTDLLVDLLKQNNIRLRQNGHTLRAVSYFVYDKGRYARMDNKPLGLGLVYEKVDGSKTQDIFMIQEEGEIERYYGEKDLVKKYSEMRDVHKRNLPI